LRVRRHANGNSDHAQDQDGYARIDQHKCSLDKLVAPEYQRSLPFNLGQPRPADARDAGRVEQLAVRPGADVELLASQTWVPQLM